MPRKKKKQLAEDVELLGEMDLQKMIQGNTNKYLMINLVAGRAYDLKRGARTLVTIEQPHGPLDLALAEGVAGLLRTEKKEREKKIVNLVEAE